ncbi:MAG TPA: DUF2203 domain-containing protein [Bryobacteraceae bacterium]|nr:DUF2203 domain-containing protein [Bryobacteraceae bacterium]
MPKRFTLSEAQSLIPEITRLLQKVVELKSEYEEAERVRLSFTERVMLMGGLAVNREQVSQMKQRRDEAATRLRNGLDELREVGCVVKDLDIGLVDFPTLFRGQEVYMCWKLGETAIEFWHGVEEGFVGRKPIDDDFRAHHEGERAQ